MPHTHFYIPRRERLGLIGWTLLALLVWWLPQWFPSSRPDYAFADSPAAKDRADQRPLALLSEPVAAELSPFDPNTVTQEELVAMGLPERAARGWVNYRRAAGDYADLAALQRVRAIPAAGLDRLVPYLRFGPNDAVNTDTPAREIAPADNATAERAPEFFSFDPNAISDSDLQRLGLTEREARSLQRYRSAGGEFRTEADWLRLRAVPAEKLRALLPYLDLPPAGETSPVTERPTVYEDTPRTPGPIDINRADAATWRRLPGIGEYWSGRILAFRRALGGFVSVEQVAETRGLPDSVFQQIRAYLQPGELLGRIQINSTTEEELARHPYVSRRQATVLIAFRTQRGRLTEDDFRNFRAMDAADRERLLPYLSFE